MFTVPKAGCANVKVHTAFAPLTPLAATPLISRSDASTFCTGLENVTVTVVKLYTSPAEGATFCTVGGARLGSTSVARSSTSIMKSLLLRVLLRP